MATEYNWFVPRGTTDSQTIEILNAKTNEAIDITGSTIYFTVKDSTGEPIISKTITEHEDAENGKSAISLSKTDTSIAIGRYSYDIVIDFDPESDDSERLQLVPVSTFGITQVIGFEEPEGE